MPLLKCPIVPVIELWYPERVFLSYQRSGSLPNKEVPVRLVGGELCRCGEGIRTANSPSCPAMALLVLRSAALLCSCTLVQEAERINDSISVFMRLDGVVRTATAVDYSRLVPFDRRGIARHPVQTVAIEHVLELRGPRFMSTSCVVEDAKDKPPSELTGLFLVANREHLEISTKKVPQKSRAGCWSVSASKRVFDISIALIVLLIFRRPIGPQVD